MKKFAAIIMISSLALACSKKEAPQEKPAEDKVAKAEKPVAQKKVRIRGLAPDAPRSRTEDAAIPEDFEEEAARTVALENLEAELDRLEAEIVADAK